MSEIPEQSIKAVKAVRLVRAVSTWEATWQIVADVRDKYPRAADDAPTDEIVDALVNAGLITERTD